MHRGSSLLLLVLLGYLAGCSKQADQKSAANPQSAAPPFQVDVATAGTITGSVQLTGAKPTGKVIDMDSDADCARLHPKGKMIDDGVVADRKGNLENVFVYIKSGMEGRKFAARTETVTIDQKGCWFRPRMLGIQTGQLLQVTNSDPVTHNIHPLAQVNREWNHSQGQGDPPLSRRFVRQEVLIGVKCNVHKWMHASIGVVDHPYFSVTGADGTFSMPNVPPGKYTIAAVHETLGEQEQTVTVGSSQKLSLSFSFKGK